MGSVREYITRRQIVTLLKHHGELTVKELSKLIGITPMGVRGHLSRLENEGVVEFNSRHTRRGRPTLYYRLGKEAASYFPETSGQVAVELLAGLEPEQITSLFQHRQRILKKYYEERLAGKSFQGKVAELAKKRDEEGYMCESTGATKLIEYHCPISLIARGFPQACEFELNLFRSVLGTDVKRVKHIMRGDNCCAYLIGKKSS